MKNLIATTSLIERYSYAEASEIYSRVFPLAFDAVRGQILKFERLQSYREPGKPWDDLLQQGNVAEAVKFIPDLIQQNQADYTEFKKRGVEFIRCRPIIFPASPYLKWEIQAYRETSKHFEKIYWCLYTQLDDVFDCHACHDFMIFDARMAIIQNYTADGLFCGGWLIDRSEDVVELLGLFAFIKANCISLDLLISDKLKF